MNTEEEVVTRRSILQNTTLSNVESKRKVKCVELNKHRTADPLFWSLGMKCNSSHPHANLDQLGSTPSTLFTAHKQLYKASKPFHTNISSEKPL
ncbi:unnamed protein product [Sphenostylis stenocarpa]|uniref:Uncharacterized protein n=1 Tax=Sphenostylis stenocarpa TaxID=92480 RepID=A0AA86T009_9FABA|nr:unnamed protein product [Sphenostylis stenocarpa]